MSDDEQLEKSNRFLRLRNAQGKSISVVREVYRRDDLPCQSTLCIGGCENSCAELSLLPDDVTHYLVPDCQVSREYLEILEIPQITGIIFTQTAVHSVQHEGNRRLHRRLKNIVKDPRKRSVLFHNEFQKYAWCEREAGETLAHWQGRSTYKAADWFFNHLAGRLPIVMLTEDKKTKEEFSNKTVNVFVLHVSEYLSMFWTQIQPQIVDLYESITAALETKNTSKNYSGHLPADVLEAGLKSARYIQGYLYVSKTNASQEAFVKRLRQSKKEESGSDIFIFGSSARNRAVHGDVVAVEMLPRSEWRGKSLAIHDGKNEAEKKDTGDPTEESTEVFPTGQVVGILQRNWREYVASFAQDEASGQGGNKAGKMLVIPWDYRIPKIRISTRQVDKLRENRIVVRIDSWEADSQYPNGHFVRSLGQIGDLEAEVAAILVENSIQVSAFSDAQLKELPCDTPEQPWKMEEIEVKSRRDLRESHLVFSIDPKGCEDVDDTLSVRQLDNGNIELGVHIADVTQFVTPGSLTDTEARMRSTTVYLADRRFDMLPSILSANLCSLVSGVDRYAVSVIWELDSKFEVVNVWYGRTLIRSKYKLFYEFAQSLHEGLSMEEVVENVPELASVPAEELAARVEELRMAVNNLMKIAHNLKLRRLRGGALELESVEVQVELSETKSVQDLTPKEHLEVHDTVAECMIYANHWVAKKIAETFSNQALLRHHPLPRNQQFDSLEVCASARGFHIDTGSSKSLAESLNKCVDDSDPLVNKILRTLATLAMSNAAYFSTGSLDRDQFFHYGLALDLYTHFTSPIRRYADVIVHRQLLAAVGTQGVTNLPSNTELDEMSQHINQRHRAAQNSQRASQELFQSLYFKGRSPDDPSCVADAIIFQLRANAVFVYVSRYGIKGPVYLRSKEGQVVYIQADCEPEWTGGSLTRTDQSITVNCLYGTQSYTLLDHITVRITLNESWAHALSVRLELISTQPLRCESQNTEDGAVKQQKASMIKEVSAAAEEKRSHLAAHDLGVNFPKLKEQYGQTPQSDSNLYYLFESFKDMGLTP